jgi:hypothetical protein
MQTNLLESRTPNCERFNSALKNNTTTRCSTLLPLPLPRPLPSSPLRCPRWRAKPYKPQRLNFVSGNAIVGCAATMRAYLLRQVLLAVSYCALMPICALPVPCDHGELASALQGGVAWVKRTAPDPPYSTVA